MKVSTSRTRIRLVIKIHHLPTKKMGVHTLLWVHSSRCLGARLVWYQLYSYTTMRFKLWVSDAGFLGLKCTSSTMNSVPSACPHRQMKSQNSYLTWQEMSLVYLIRNRFSKLNVITKGRLLRIQIWHHQDKVRQPVIPANWFGRSHLRNKGSKEGQYYLCISGVHYECGSSSYVILSRSAKLERSNREIQRFSKKSDKAEEWSSVQRRQIL